MRKESISIPEKFTISKHYDIPAFFIAISLIFLFLGLCFGALSSFQYIFPEWLRNAFPFSRMRTLHVSLVIFWIFTAATGGIYFYIQEFGGKQLYSRKMAWLHGIVLLIVTISIFASYTLGKFGGREYLEFPVWIGIPLIFYWLLFMVNIFKSYSSSFKEAPIYLWMWATGLIFFLLTFLESQLWLLSFFGENIIRDTTVQWKALGSMVGSWNMLVYGTAFYLMEKISGDRKVANSKQTFFFYFLGLTNLMFNWGHHTYIVPASPWIKHIAYFISMTELLILANIIREWSSSVKVAQKHFHLITYRFLIAADVWIFLNLILAIAMSVPAINAYTHGTHITVAHAMGTTIGINSMILLASISYMNEKFSFSKMTKNGNWIKKGFWISNISLLIFWLSLLTAGFIKSTMSLNSTHREIISQQIPCFVVISISGLLLLFGFSLIILPFFNISIRKIIGNKNDFSS